jgi:hypothetical protein
MMSAVPYSVCSPNQLMVARLQARGYVANVPFLLRATGDLELETLRDAFQLIVDRHDILRSRFAFIDGVLVNYAAEPYQVALALEDVSGSTAPLAAALVASGAACRQPFDLYGPDRLRLTVYRLSASDYVVTVIIDHLAADGMSLAQIGAEWRSFYQAIEAGTPFTASATVPLYRDFATWQQAWLASSDAETQRSWWTEQLRGFAWRDRDSSSSTGAFPARSLEFQLGAKIARQLSALCTRHRLRPFMAILSAYALLLADMNGEQDLLIATVRANRRRETARVTVGHFANLIPLRMVIDGAMSGEDFLRLTAETCRASYARDELPFLDIAKTAWQRVGVPAASLARFSINFVPFAAEPVAWSASLRLSQLWGLIDPEPLATSRLALFIRQQGSVLGGTINFDPATLDSAWVESFPERLEAMISQLALRQIGSVAALLAKASPGRSG